MGRLAASLKQTQFADTPNFRESLQPGQIGQALHAVPMRSARLVPALVLIPIVLACLAPPAASEPTQVVTFRLLPGLPQSWDVIPYGDAWVEVVVLKGGSATGLDLDGPGTCAGVTINAVPASPVAPGTSTRVKCGKLVPMNEELSIGAIGGYASGYIVLHGLA